MTFKGLKKLILYPRIFLRDYINNKDTKITLKIDGVNFLKLFTHVLHSGEGENGINHLNLWIPFFLKSNIEFLVVTRHIVTYENVRKEYPLINVVLAKNNKEVKYIFNKLVYLKACFYPSNNGINIHPLEYNNIKHIFIGHGDSDKLTSAHKRFRVYDENWVASDAHIDRFNNAGFDFSGLKFIKVGRPNLLKAIESSQIIWNKRYNIDIKLLYLSTWEGSTEEQNYSSIYLSKEIMTELNKFINISLSLKLHPALGIRDNKLKHYNVNLKNYFSKNKINVNFYEGKDLVSNLICVHNVFICDISAVVSECLSMDSPIFVYLPNDKKIKLSNSKMKFEDYTYTFSSTVELIKKLTIVLEGDDYLSANRQKAMEYILGRTHISNNKFIDELIKI